MNRSSRTWLYLCRGLGLCPVHAPFLSPDLCLGLDLSDGLCRGIGGLDCLYLYGNTTNGKFTLTILLIL